MNRDMMGIIFASDKETHFNELTQIRSVAALPFGGRYRLIDFILSNMVNSGIINVGVATQINYSSLMDHLGSGSPWDLNRKSTGLFMLPPYIRGTSSRINDGNIDLLYGVITFLKRSRQQYVLLAGGNVVCNMTFSDALQAHIDNKADVTVIYHNEDKDSGLDLCNVYEVDEGGRITGMEQEPRYPKTTLAGMEMFIVERLKLIEMIEEAYSRGSHDFIRDILLANLDNLKICGYEFKGYVARINTIKSYYAANMQLLDDSVRRELFESENLIFTKVKNQVPTRYQSNATVENSLIADGCTINGRVENCIIFRGVQIGKGSVIKNSIIMQNSVIEENCDLENVVIDKECTVRREKRLVGQPNYPVILPKRTLL